jgi:hypothetical protein
VSLLQGGEIKHLRVGESLIKLCPSAAGSSLAIDECDRLGKRAVELRHGS